MILVLMITCTVAILTTIFIFCEIRPRLNAQAELISFLDKDLKKLELKERNHSYIASDITKLLSCVDQLHKYLDVEEVQESRHLKKKEPVRYDTI